jgi:hypothetical protein
MVLRGRDQRAPRPHLTPALGSLCVLTRWWQAVLDRNELAAASRPSRLVGPAASKRVANSKAGSRGILRLTRPFGAAELPRTSRCASLRISPFLLVRFTARVTSPGRDPGVTKADLPADSALGPSSGLQPLRIVCWFMSRCVAISAMVRPVAEGGHQPGGSAGGLGSN